MKRPSRKSRRAALAEPRLWTQTQARSAIPYLTSVLRSLREHALEVQSAERRLTRLEQRPGRPDRAALIAADETRRDLDGRRQQLAQTAHELEAVGAIPLDPVQGQAVLPFTHDNRLAWYVFDLFDSNPLRWWRYQEDPDDFRRPLTSAQSGSLEASA